MIWVRVQHLPADSALVGVLTKDAAWSRTEYLLDDIRAALTDGKPHPARPKPAKKRLDRRRISDGQKRRAERKRRITAGEIT